MGFIYNIAASSKRTGSEDGPCVKHVARPRKSPQSCTEFLVDKQQVIQGIFLQDNTMMSVHLKIPEVNLADATHNMKKHKMPFGVLIFVDRNCSSHVESVFFFF